MEFQGKEKRPYHGIWIAFIAMIAFPAVIFGVLYWAVSNKTSYSHDEIFYMLLGFVGAIGVFFCVILILTGMIGDLFEAMIKRIRETHDYYGLLSKEGFSYYWYNFFHDGGPIMWLFFLVMIGYAVTSVLGFIKYFSLL